MLNALIDFHLRHRFLVLAGLTVLIGGGVYTLLRIPIDAFPDLTNNQVVVLTECPGMAPAEVEQLVTFPIETALMGIQKAETVRSISKLGLSMVTVVLDDSVATYFARQLVNERLQEARARMPEGLEPSLGPVATAFGEVYQYTVEGRNWSAMDLKTLHDWQIKNQLRTVPGISEVNTWGGETRQYEIEADPWKLEQYGLTLRDLFERVRENNANFSAGFIEHASEQYNVVGHGRTRDAADLERIVVKARQGTPVLLRDVARVKAGAAQRQGAVLRDGEGETVSGMTIMLKGENSREVIAGVKRKLATLRLPEGVRILPFYDQSEVIDGTIRTVRNNLLEAGLLVVGVLLLFLANIRAALIVAAVIPLSMLVGFLGMAAFGVSANLMSLGAIDFGMIVDGAVVMMENSARKLRRQEGDRGFDPLERVREAAHEVARPIVFAVAIIIAVYLPIFYLEGLEGLMFRPMAITVCASLLGSLVIALTVVPTATAILLRRGVSERGEWWMAGLRGAYRGALTRVLRHKAPVVAFGFALVAFAGWSLTHLGSEFMPRLEEGSILITTRKLPGISLTDSVALSRRVERVILRFPEVRGVVTKLGRPDLATEAMGIYEADVYVMLKPQSEWQAAGKEELIAKMAAALEQVPGIASNFTQPMAMRLDEVVSGIKADLALKIFGEDAGELERLAERALRILSSIPGAADAQMEVISGGGELHVEVDRPALARYGMNVSDVRDLIQAAVVGRPMSEMIEGQRRFAVVLRLPEHYRGDAEALRDLPISAPSGERVRLGQLARVMVRRGPEVVYRERGQRRIVVQSNVRGRDLGGFAAEAQQRVARQLALPPGYLIDWGGQFENQQRAMRRLAIVVPASLLIIFVLLIAAFDSAPQALLILSNVPFALVGGVAALWARDLNLNLSSSIGFIALSGVAVLNGIVMVSYINRLRARGMGIEPAILEGAATRLRPVLMTALVASLGFVPMAIATSTGAEVQRPLATVVIGGLFTSTLLTLFVLPAMYAWFSPASARPRYDE